MIQSSDTIQSKPDQVSQDTKTAVTYLKLKKERKKQKNNEWEKLIELSTEPVGPKQMPELIWLLHLPDLNLSVVF